ncbi:hypothetical protein [Bacillus sp. FJAT-27264]|nr:hypothetical protein [Bacillus sp. FJAT-27264]
MEREGERRREKEREGERRREKEREGERSIVNIIIIKLTIALFINNINN